MTKCAQVLTKICQMLSQVILLKIINFVALTLSYKYLHCEPNDAVHQDIHRKACSSKSESLGDLICKQTKLHDYLYKDQKTLQIHSCTINPSNKEQYTS